MERFYIRVFLLVYLSATANELYQSGFKVFHLVGVELNYVWPLSADLSGMGKPTGDFYLQPVQLYRSWRHTNVSTTVKVHANEH